MVETRPKIRLHVDAALATGTELALSAGQAHYLRAVMRQAPGAAVRLFNGRDGEWRAELTRLGKRDAAVTVRERLRPQAVEADLWLLFAPLKRGPQELLVQKATELGVARLQPVVTRFTDAVRAKPERLQAIAIEAAEQCERLSVPELAPARPLADCLADWPAERALLFCDERGGTPLAALLQRSAPADGAAILVGPEGGFDDAERASLLASGFAEAVSLGPRTLRAETAAIAAIVLWQALAGDDRPPPSPAAG